MKDASNSQCVSYQWPRLKCFKILDIFQANCRYNTVEYSLESTRGVKIKEGIWCLENLQAMTNVQSKWKLSGERAGEVQLVEAVGHSKIDCRHGERYSHLN
ncbi:hypothetical protein L484_018703 [Morus notabilis]|uniref:Uncharacterized protein n=1 Tax=Morus notabilis TaxID=981085 RepID=W9RG99_9ROSA|nr:hypothetical protein L484_018703 [Morus notabilis]